MFPEIDANMKNTDANSNLIPQYTRIIIWIYYFELLFG